MLKYWAIFDNCTVDRLFTLIADETERLKWDKILTTFKVIKSINKNSDVIYNECKTPQGFSNRDFVQFRYYLNNKRDKEVVQQHNLYQTDHDYSMIYVRSVDQCIEIPVKKGVVRGNTLIAGYLIEEIKNTNKVKLTTIIQTDIKGSVPKILHNSLSSEIPIKWLRELEKAYKAKWGV
eukprot:TRINITY_DN7025_c0_g1_i3.p2 TRINITY_DN7025_c0_g1~~TRINITY_DN7025_c0_g1_i3.p2  ORF type:complete len:178 (-),score=42.31 TRINITY_DN7025_c0_g1_i3:191-724(-)